MGSGTSFGVDRCVCRGLWHYLNEYIGSWTNSRIFEIFGGYALVPFDPIPKFFSPLDRPRAPGSNEVSRVQIRRRLTPQSQFPIFWGVGLCHFSRKPRGRPYSNPHNCIFPRCKNGLGRGAGRVLARARRWYRSLSYSRRRLGAGGEKPPKMTIFPLWGPPLTPLWGANPRNPRHFSAGPQRDVHTKFGEDRPVNKGTSLTKCRAVVPRNSFVLKSG